MSGLRLDRLLRSEEPNAVQAKLLQAYPRFSTSYMHFTIEQLLLTVMYSTVLFVTPA
jgi:hypothetical protein